MYRDEYLITWADGRSLTLYYFDNIISAIDRAYKMRPGIKIISVLLKDKS